MVGKILIVDSVATNRIVFKAAFAEAFYQPIFAADGKTCLRLTSAALPDLVLLNLSLPDLTGIAVLRRLRADPGLADTPILALAEADQGDLRLDALLAGADDVLPHSTDTHTLLARVRNLLRGRAGISGFGPVTPRTDPVHLAESAVIFQRPALISVMASQAATAQALKLSLAELMRDRISVQSREDAFLDTQIEPPRTGPDVFLIEENGADVGSSLRLISELRSRSSTLHSAICLLRPKESRDGDAIAYDLGADDVINSDSHPREIAARLRVVLRRKLHADHRRATVQDGLRLAVIDPLTGLHNRRYALPQLASIAEQAAEDGSVFAVMIIDLDKFKSVNDRFGHAAGDSVLVEVAGRLRANLRADDLLARIGGEEFLVALPNTNFKDASAAAARLCQAIEENKIAFGNAFDVRVTVSIGLAISKTGSDAEPSAKIMDRADRALLKAKAEGRNKVTISKDAA